MLAQLNQDIPQYGELVHGQRLGAVSQLALLPATLIAAEEVGLARYDLPSLRLAVEAWRMSTAHPVDVADTVMAWWETYAAERPAWAVALAALSRMIDGQVAEAGGGDSP